MLENIYFTFSYKYLMIHSDVGTKCIMNKQSACHINKVKIFKYHVFYFYI